MLLRLHSIEPGDTPSFGESYASMTRGGVAFNKTAGHIQSRTSLQKMEADGRNAERAVHYHGHIGLSGHERELLFAV
jgi:hypothetical protein